MMQSTTTNPDNDRGIGSVHFEKIVVVVVIFLMLISPYLKSDFMNSEYVVHDEDLLRSLKEEKFYKPIPLEQLVLNVNTADQEKQSMMCKANGMYYVQDKIVEFDISHPHNRKIPKVIHMTGKSRCVAQEFADTIRKWQEFDKEFAFYFHDDDAIHTLFHSNIPYYTHYFPYLHNVIKCITTGTAKADIWRYLMLWEYGGIYVDMDVAPNLSNFIPSLISNTDEAFFVVDSTGALSQHFIASSKSHPLIENVLNMALTNLRHIPNVMINNPPQTTGVKAMKGGFLQFLNDAQNQLKDIIKDRFYVTEGKYMGGIDNSSSITVVGSKKDSSQYLFQHAVTVLKKKTAYIQMNMTHFHDTDDPHKYPDINPISCEEHIKRTAGTDKVANYRFDAKEQKYIE